MCVGFSRVLFELRTIKTSSSPPSAWPFSSVSEDCSASPESF